MVHIAYMGSLAMTLQNIFPAEFFDPMVIFALVYKLGHFSLQKRREKYPNFHEYLKSA